MAGITVTLKKDYIGQRSGVVYLRAGDIVEGALNAEANFDVTKVIRSTGKLTEGPKPDYRLELPLEHIL